MDDYLQHLKSFRNHVQDHEDNAASISARQRELQTAIYALQDELGSVQTETKRCTAEIDGLAMERLRIYALLQTAESDMAKLVADNAALIQALEGLNHDLQKQSDVVREKKSYFESCLLDATTEFQKYQAFHQSCASDGVLKV